MEKLTGIVVVLEEPAGAATILRKAVDLARRFDARLEFLVLEPLQTEAIVPHCAALGYADFKVRGVSCVGQSRDSVILRHVQECHPDLVIKARRGNHPLRRYSLGESDWRLSRDCPVPLMLVDWRPWAEPLRLAAAIDVSDPETLGVARAVLHTAGFLALGSHGNLDILYTEREQHDETLRMQRAVTLAQLVREFHVGCERLQIFDGDPEKRLPPLIAARRYDLLLVGATTHRTGLADAIWPLTGRLVEATSGDVVLIKEKAEKPVENRAMGASIAEQVSHQGKQFV